MPDADCTNPQLQSPLNVSSKDKFIMILELPYILRKRAASDPNIDITPLQISVFGTIVPDITVPAIDARYGGQNLHLSTYARPNYPPLSINFVVDNGYKNYFLLWKWLDVMNLAMDSYYGGTERRTNEDFAMTGDQFEYQTTISILALDEYNEPSLEFKYTKAFVTRLGGITYSYRDAGIVESSADFYFSQLEVIKNTPKTNISK